MAQWVARAAVALVILGLLAYGALLSHNATEANRAFTCSIADLVTIGGGASKDGVKGSADHAQAELDFLTGIREAGCPFIAEHPSVKRQINQAIRALSRRLENE